MSLSSALFSGISGLGTLGNSMTVIGDNLANVNTVGFKASRVTFQDALSQSVATAAGTAQVGRGTSLADISSSFAQGSFESTDSTTDLAIGGEGFFVVRDPNSPEDHYYTRAGEFRFDKDGNFVNPEGYIVRGWALNPSTGEDQGSITDIVLQSFTSSPSKTDQITLITNLDADANSKSATLREAWDGANASNQYIGDSAYEYQTTVKVYDSLGSTHDITIYYDKGSGSTYEYIVVCNPDEDNRQGLGLVSADTGLGMLGSGTITFNEASGAIQGITFSRFIGDSPGMDVTDTSGLATSTSSPTLYHNLDETPTAATYGFRVQAGAGGTVGTDAITIEWDDDGGVGYGDGSFTIAANYTPGTILDSTDGAPTGMELSFTAGTLVATETFEATVAAGDADDLTSAYTWADISTAQLSNDGYFELNADFLGGINTGMDVEIDFGSSYNTASTSWENDSLSTTQYSSASTTTLQSASGYGAGDLQSVNVGTDGAITGQYSNGQVIPLYRVVLAKFQNNQGLFKVGGNLFRETRLSGDPLTGRPGNSGLGSVSPNSLEQSNVDIATEFVKMITTQRGFQANSKIITVTDQMLAELINLKR
jgi:flagellar hook protein FlgE